MKAFSPRTLWFALGFTCITSTLPAAPKDPTPAKTASPKSSATPAKSSDAPTPPKTLETVLYVPGGYQNYKPGIAPQIGAVNGSSTMFEGYINITGEGSQGFKFTDAPDWDHNNYGDGGPGTLSKNGQAPDLTVPVSGYYELTADLNKNTWTATKTTWSVIGNATPGGWDKDTPMTYDADRHLWTVTLPLKADGSFKFRANNAWKIDFGLDPDGKLQYVDNPFFTYNPSLKELTVAADGTYTVTLDLHVPGKYAYSIDPK